ncbi:MAG: J domain-containing protein [Haloarculaceae archaeon]
MNYDRLIEGVAAVFAGLTVLLVVVAVLYNPAVLFVALAFAASAYLMYYHASGRMAGRLYERVERQAASNAGDRGGFGAGPREGWVPPRDGRRARDVAGGRDRRQGGRRKQRGRGQRGQRTVRDGPSAAEAYRTLGLEPGADQSAIKRAYREKVKEVHPDNGGDEESFMAVKDAYERLSDD